MNTTRRVLLASIIPAILSQHKSAFAQQGYPSRPVSLVVGFSPGSSTDVATRIIADRLGSALGQKFLVENKPGASSKIAANWVARAPEDGYVFFVATVANVINDSLNPGSSSIADELTPVCLLGTAPNILVVPRASSAASVADLIALAKSKPGALSYGSAGLGTSPHMSGELFSQMAGVKLLHVPYTGTAQAVTDLLAGRLDLMFSPASSVLAQVRAGSLRALASTEAQRTPVAPDLPTVAEAGLPGFDTSVWFGLMAPNGAPRDELTSVESAVFLVLGNDQTQSLLNAQGIDPLVGGPVAFKEYIGAETRKWTIVAERAGMAKR